MPAALILLSWLLPGRACASPPIGDLVELERLVAAELARDGFPPVEARRVRVDGEAVLREARRRGAVLLGSRAGETQALWRAAGMLDEAGTLEETLERWARASGPLLLAGDGIVLAPEVDLLAARLSLVHELTRQALARRLGVEDLVVPGPWPDDTAAVRFAGFEGQVRREARRVVARIAARLVRGLSPGGGTTAAFACARRSGAPGIVPDETPPLLRRLLERLPRIAERSAPPGAVEFGTRAEGVSERFGLPEPGGDPALPSPPSGSIAVDVRFGPVGLESLLAAAGDPARGAMLFGGWRGDRARLVVGEGGAYVWLRWRLADADAAGAALEAARKVLERLPKASPGSIERDDRRLRVLRFGGGGLTGFAFREGDEVELAYGPSAALAALAASRLEGRSGRPLTGVRADGR